MVDKPAKNAARSRMQATESFFGREQHTLASKSASVLLDPTGICLEEKGANDESIGCFLDQFSISLQIPGKFVFNIIHP